MALYLRGAKRLEAETTAFLYCWTHIPSKKWYVGSRTAIGCHPNDGYICSSKIVKDMIVKNPKEWKREILVIGESSYIRNLENKYLLLLDATKDTMSFNKTNADGKFHRTGMYHADETKDKIRIAITGSTHSEETKIHFSNIRKGEGNPFFGKHHSNETKQMISEATTGYKHTDEAKMKITSAQIGRSRSAETKSAISIGVSNLAKKKCRHCDGEYSPALYGRWHGDKCKSLRVIK